MSAVPRLMAGFAAALLLVRIAAAQEVAPETAPEPVPSSDAVPAPRKSKPRPKPRPASKPAAKTDSAETKPPPAVEAAPSEPIARPATPAAASSPTSPSAARFAAPVVACDPGLAVRYDGGTGTDSKGAELWVTRTGTVTVDNPLRPLTPDVTRVLQVVVGAKLATVYGPDLMDLRRGPSPGSLEGMLGGPIRWDTALGTLPEALTLASEAGRTPTELRFRACGEAPAVKTPAARAPAAARRRTPAVEKAEAPAGEDKAPADGRRAAPKAAVKTPPGFSLPQGAIQ